MSLLERREGEGAVRPGAQDLGPDGFLSHQRRGGGEGRVLAVLWVMVTLLALLLGRQSQTGFSQFAAGRSKSGRQRTPDLCPRQEPKKRGPSEGHQGADAEREAVVEQGGAALGRRARGADLSLLGVLVQVGQLEAAAQQQVQELGLSRGQTILRSSK